MIQPAQTPAPSPTSTIPVPPVPPPPPTPEAVIVQAPSMPPPWVTLPPPVTLLIALGFFAACAVILRPLFNALGRRLEGRSAELPRRLQADLDQLRQRLEELEAVPGRVLELEERVDFAERLLAQRREAERLERGAP
jgi:hypothetical protein